MSPGSDVLTYIAPRTVEEQAERLRPDAWRLWQELRHSSSAHSGYLRERSDYSHVLLAFKSPRAAVRFALNAVDRADEDEPGRVRLGMHLGSPPNEDGLARVAIQDALRSSEDASIVVSTPVAEAVKDFVPRDFQLRALAHVEGASHRYGWFALERPQLDWKAALSTDPAAALPGMGESQYLGILRRAISDGVRRSDRTGVGTRAIFGEVMRFRLRDGFPAITTKRLAFRSVVAELLWFIAGSSDIGELNALGVHIWDGNALADYWTPKARFPGDAGRNYGQQWRDWISPDGKHFDQLADVVRAIGTHPSSRRHVVTAWNPGELEMTSLPACHALFQFFVSGRRLSLTMYQRSADLFLGVPFNIAQYALMLHLIAQITGLVPHELVHVLGDAHVYRTHVEPAGLQLTRDPFAPPKLWLDPSLRSLDDVVARYHDIVRRARSGERAADLLDTVAHLEDYRFHRSIKATLAV